MERNRRWVVAPRPAIISAVLVTIALFISFAAWGMHNWTVLSIGLAVLAGGVALFVISAMNSKVRGVAHIIQVNPPPGARYRGRVTATAVVRYKARRDTIRVVLREDDVPLNKWPALHDELPVVGLSNDLWTAEVLWAQVPTHKRVAAKRRRAETRESAAAAAAAAAGQATAGDEAAAAPTDAAATGEAATVTVTVEHHDPDDGEVTEVAEPAATAVSTDVPEVDLTDDDPGTGDDSGRSRWSPPGSGKVVEGVWWDSYGVHGSRLEADITTPDPPPPNERPPGSKPSPRPRRPPEDVIIGITFGATPAEDTERAANTDSSPLDAPLTSEGATAGPIPRQPSGSRLGEDAPAGAPDADTDSDSPADPLNAGPINAGPRHLRHDDAAVDPSGLIDPGAPTVEQPANLLHRSPITVLRAGVLAPGVPTPRTESEPYDHAYDHEAVALAYRDALPPPGTSSARRADVTVTLFVVNLSRSIVFYRDVLGFTEIDAGRRSAVLDLRDIRVILKVVDAIQPSSKNVQFSLEVDDLETAYEDLRARGVIFVHRPRRVGHYEQLEHLAAPFEDPDGHRISLSSWR